MNINPQDYPLPLPENPYPSSAFRKAYAKCQDLEHRNPGSMCLPAITAARILGYLLLAFREGPLASKTGHELFEQKINGAENDEKLIAVGKHVLDTFIIQFTRASDFNPPSYDEESYDEEYDTVSNTDEPKSDRYIAREQALERDRYRCLLTGACDLFSFMPDGYLVPAGRAIRAADPRARFAPTRATYIIPESMEDTSPGCSSEKKAHIDEFWKFLAEVSNDQIPIPFDVHCLENILTLDYDMYGDFLRLYTWLEPTDIENTYAVRTRLPILVAHCPMNVTFTTKDSEKFPVPSRALLKLHATCCEVTWKSGASGYLYNIEREIEERELQEVVG